MWNEIIYPFPNFNDCTVEVWEWINNFPSLILLDMWFFIHAVINLNHGSKGVLGSEMQSVDILSHGKQMSAWLILTTLFQAPKSMYS